MKLWSKTDNLNKMIENFTVGSDRKYDMYLAKYDVLASKVHVKMLHKIRILNDIEVKRPALGVRSKYKEIIIGSKLKKNVSMGSPINFNDLKVL